eukprot:GHRR01028419.1.p1 GENE.GHRR01028419.1~~GHRR01028419.1.p1  ORF type:complete len:127 (-),score=17.16 GHRR01028419.1:363-743(-)
MLQLHLACEQRIGVIIVGPSGSGKSTLWQVCCMPCGGRLDPCCTWCVCDDTFCEEYLYVVGMLHAMPSIATWRRSSPFPTGHLYMAMHGYLLATSNKLCEHLSTLVLLHSFECARRLNWLEAGQPQ